VWRRRFAFCGVQYDPVSVVLLTEIMKLVLAGLLWIRETAVAGRSTVKGFTHEFDRQVALLYAVPALSKHHILMFADPSD